MSKRQTARAVIFNSKGEILFIERYKHGKHYFVLPGGHVEMGETPEDSLIREVFEETGLRVEIDKLIRSEVDAFDQLQHIYQCKTTDGLPMLQPHSIEAKAMRASGQVWRPAWRKLDELKGQIVYPRWLQRWPV